MKCICPVGRLDKYGSPELLPQGTDPNCPHCYPDKGAPMYFSCIFEDCGSQELVLTGEGEYGVANPVNGLQPRWSMEVQCMECEGMWELHLSHERAVDGSQRLTVFPVTY